MESRVLCSDLKVCLHVDEKPNRIEEATSVEISHTRVDPTEAA